MKKFVDFKNPPLVETVCGVQFKDLTSLRIHHIGLFWQTIQREFPVVNERGPLPNVKEQGSPTSDQSLQFLTEPPFPRVWFATEDKKGLIQLQKDRFLYNWKVADEQSVYPSFQVVYERFSDNLAKFEKFLVQSKLDPLEFNQYEVTYVNHIGPTNGLKELGHGALFRNHLESKDADRFLKDTETIDWRATYLLPDGWGRLHARAVTAFVPERRNEKIIRLDLVARGWPNSADEKLRLQWFEIAHEWITKGFKDMTTTEAHKIWGILT